jgi:tetratricopeptide (TPR) repeat protein
MSNEFEKTYSIATELFEAGNYAQAKPLLTKLLQTNPKGYADVFNKLGVICHQEGELPQAADYFERALKLNPKYTEVSLNLAVTYSEMGRYEEADRIFSQAASVVRSEPDSVDPFILGKLANEHGKLGDQYHFLGRYDDAIEEYQKALRLRPSFADIHTKLGIAYRDKGDLDHAILQLSRSKEINPKYLPTYIQLGITFYIKGFVDLAMEEWEAAQKIDPTGRQASVYLSLAKKEYL